MKFFNLRHLKFFKTVNLPFILILSIALILRFYSLDSFPNGLQRDEAYVGYNAFSILKTGREISGDFLPLHLRSFIFTPAGSSYFSIPSVLLFDLNVFSIRFPFAFFGFLTIPIFCLLSKELVNREKMIKNIIFIPMISTLFLAISPWHINLSRTASNITPVVFFIVLGTYLYLVSLKKNNIFLLILSFLSFFSSLAFYISPYSFLPIFIPLLLFFFPTKQKKIFFVLYSLFILLPLVITLMSSSLSLRVNSLSILKHPEASLVIAQNTREDGMSKIDPKIVRFFHNKPAQFGEIFLENYFKHFSFSFFFTDHSLPDRYRIPQVGIMYLFEFILLLFGIYVVVRQNFRTGYFLILWALISPIGSSLSFDDVPNMQRTLYLLPPLLFIESMGIYQLSKMVNKKFLIVVSLTVISLSLIYYIHQYYIHGPVYRPWYRQDGYKELVLKLNKHLGNYNEAVITNRETAPTIQFLFFEKADPFLFQQKSKNKNLQKTDMIDFGKYKFVGEECPLREEVRSGESKLIGEKGTLYVNSGLCEVPVKAKVLEKIQRADSSTVFYILSL